ncbi:MAG: zinc ribbon domain-containing protein [Candidatus Cloacimonetes bacterium]|nr:zinc ribbon domain-containing protein [Candidatus Cloacimonadota bacterium]
MNKIVLYACLMILFSASLFAMFCPECGTKNQDKFKYCYSCGEKLPQGQSQSQFKKPTKSSETITAEDLYDYDSNLVYPGKETSKNQQMIDKLQKQIAAQRKLYKNKRSNPGTIGSNPKDVFSFLNGGASKQLMGLQGKNISESQLLELNESPQVNQLMNQMKSQNFQKNILEGLKQMKGQKGADKKIGSSINQLEALFQMLNMQGAMGGNQP